MALFVDSTVWAGDIYARLPGAQAIISSDIPLATSTISLLEIKRKLLQDGLCAKVEPALSFIRRRAAIVDVNRHIAELAAEISFKHKLSMADAIIYASAIETKAEALVTADTDFKGLKNVRLLAPRMSG
jgi:predicted nucleic acid-binding protein